MTLVERAEPRWLFVAVAFQLLTYAAEGEVWRKVLEQGGFELARRNIYKLSLSKLFVDQALPSGGVSGTLVIARALERQGAPRSVVMAGVVVDSVSYHATYVVCLGAAWFISSLHHHASVILALASLGFCAFAAAVAAVLLLLAGKPPARLTRALARAKMLARGLELVECAEPRLARAPGLLLQAGVFQLAIFLLDAATLWVMVLASGAWAPPVDVFASFMAATLFRTVGILPGGLGSFEATCVITLRLLGLSVPAALSATLLFRGLSFWLPMLPGLWFARQSVRSKPA